MKLLKLLEQCIVTILFEQFLFIHRWVHPSILTILPHIRQ